MLPSKLWLKSCICDLPDEILMEVLLRVPAKMYMRLRHVSKSWKTRIDSPEFIRRAFGTMNSLIYYVDSKNVYLAGSGYMDSPESMMPAGSKIETEGMALIGSCNGLFCVSDNDGERFEARFVVMNPRTKQSVELPGLQTNLCNHPRDAAAGFGYDNVNDDYKVVRIACFSYIETLGCDYEGLNVCMYSFRANCWRDIKLEQPELAHCVRYELEDPFWGVFANGALHWTISTRSLWPTEWQCDILAFDLANEKLSLISLPSFVQQDIEPPRGKFGYGFGQVDGCLNLYDPMTNDVWTMKEYGVPDSWTKLITFQPPNVSQREFMWCRLLRYNFDARSVFEPTALASDDCLVFRNQESEVDDLILRKPNKNWNAVFTFTPSLVELPAQN